MLWFDDLFNRDIHWITSVPKGYQLVEDKEYKISRLKNTIKNYKIIIELYAKQLADAEQELKDASK
jgi:hypothetical protein